MSERQADRYAAARFPGGQAGSAGARARYAAETERLARFESQAKQVFDELACSCSVRFRLSSLVRRVYGLRRRQGDELWRLLAECVADRLVEGAGWTVVLAVVERAMSVLGREFNLAEAQVLRGLVTERLRPVGEAREEAMSRKSVKRGARQEGFERLPMAAVVDEPTPLDAVQRASALQGLRYALAGHQRIVKLVVAKRLCEHASFRELGQRYGLTREEVVDILGRMRSWVSRFTSRFNADWFWQEDGRCSVAPTRHPGGVG